MDNKDTLMKIQELTKELDMLKRSLNYKDELQAAKDKVEELARKRYEGGFQSKYVVMSKWLLEALLDGDRQFYGTSAYYYDTSIGNLQLIPLDVNEKVILVG